MRKAVAVLVLVGFPLSASAGTVYKFEETGFKVKVPKPEISYVLSRPDLAPKYEFELQESFLPRVEASVGARPF